VNTRLPCAARAELAHTLTRLDRETAYCEAVQRHIALLTAPGAEYAPYTPLHLAEALAELDRQALEALSHLFASGNTAGAGLALSVLIRDYWEDLAKSTALRMSD
jgi:hypothetical protein